MDIRATAAAIAALLVVAVFCGWRGAQPSNPVKGPRLFPYRPVMALATTGALIFLVHLVNLLGVTTGR